MALSTPEKSLIWWATNCSGGLCDRLLGLVSTYCIAKELGREFLIRWDDTDVSHIMPVQEKYNYYTYNLSFFNHLPNNHAAQDFYADKDQIKLWEDKAHVLTWSNQNLFYLFCQNRPEINYRDRLTEGFQKLQDFFHFPLLNLQVKPVGIHIRTLDKLIRDPSQAESQREVIEKIFQKLQPCIEAKEEIFLSSDCELAYEIGKTYFPNLSYQPGRVIHTAESQDKEGWLKVLGHLFSLSLCDKLYIGWHTNFARVACLLNPKREFYCYEYGENQTVKQCDFMELSSYFSKPFWRMAR